MRALDNNEKYKPGVSDLIRTNEQGTYRTVHR